MTPTRVTIQFDLLNGGHETCRHNAYRMDCGQYEALLARARGHCEICGKPGIESQRGKLHIDHDARHGMWAVRGLLCNYCNTYMHLPRMQGAALDRFLANAWYLPVLAAYGITLGDYPEPSLYAVVRDPTGQTWKHYRRGWVNVDSSLHRRRVSAWDRLIYTYGPHNLRSA